MFSEAHGALKCTTLQVGGTYLFVLCPWWLARARGLHVVILDMIRIRVGRDQEVVDTANACCMQPDKSSIDHKAVK
jgi:hypothetical protein